MKQISVIIILFVLVLPICPQGVYSPLVEQIINNCSVQSLTKLNRQFSGDTACMIGGNPYTLVSRHFEHPSNSMAAQFIYEQFQSYGYSSQYMNYSATGRNVYAVKTGTKYPNQKFIICAHYDDMPSGNIAPGADDNSSGTCAVMEAARLFAPLQFDYTIIFIAFDEEEAGLIGSHAYSDSAFNRGDSILFVFNYDMIAWDGNNDNVLNLITNTPSNKFTDKIKSVFNIYQPQLNTVKIIYDYMSQSDHWWFWQNGYKACLGIENLNELNPYYHTVNDKFTNLNIPFFHGYTKAAIAALMSCGKNYFMDFIHTPIVSMIETGPQQANVLITSPYPIAKQSNAPRLYYKFSSSSYNFVNASAVNLDTFKFIIPGAPAGTIVSYYIAAQDSLGNFVGTLPLGGKGINPPGTTEPPSVFVYRILTGIEEEQQPVKFSLEQNYPNPFNPVTNIEFNLIKSAQVKLIVTDILGREVAVLVNDKLPAGQHIVQFSGNKLSSGTYLYSVYVDGTLMGTKRMILAK